MFYNHLRIRIRALGTKEIYNQIIPSPYTPNGQVSSYLLI